jgi:hypothetical protein
MFGLRATSWVVSTAAVLAMAGPPAAGHAQRGGSGLRLVDGGAASGTDETGIVPRPDQLLGTGIESPPGDGSTAPGAAAAATRPHSGTSSEADERRDRALMLFLIRSVGSVGPFGSMGHW